MSSQKLRVFSQKAPKSQVGHKGQNSVGDQHLVKNVPRCLVDQ